MKNGSKFLKLVLVGVLGAAAMIGCSSDADSNYPEESSEYDVNGCREVYTEETDEYEKICDGPVLDCVDVYSDDEELIGQECTEVTTTPDEETTTTVEETTTTVEETTTTVEETTTTVPRPTTTVKKTTAATAPPTNAPATQAPTTVPTTTATAPTSTTTTAPTTAPPATLPPVNVRAEWSGIDAGCPENHDLYLDVNVFGATSAGTLSVRVGGSAVTSYGGSNFAIGDTTMILFDEWPTLANGTYPVTITASSSTQGPTTVTTSVTYNCPI